MSPSSSLISSALFVDFDNIYIHLEHSDPRAAEEFATNPVRWLNWLEDRLATDHFPAGESPRKRRILIRKVYVNPDSFREYRPAFVRAAFDVIDCPPLTTQNKTAADIHMVIDILEALSHQMHFEEFIILSGDADFTPVLVKLREHGRYSAVLSLSSSAAFKSASDFALSADKFVQKTLGIVDEPRKPAPPPQKQTQAKPAPAPVEVKEAAPDRAVLEKMAAQLYEAAENGAGIPAVDVLGIYKDFPEFRAADKKWFGLQGLRGLTEAIVDTHKDLKVSGGGQDWRVTRGPLEPPAAPGVWVAAETEAEPTFRDQNAKPYGEIRDTIARWIRATVPHAPRSVPLPRFEEAIVKRFAAQLAGTEWLGAGTFKQMLLDLELSPLRLSAAGEGYIYLPEKHPAPTE